MCLETDIRAIGGVPPRDSSERRDFVVRRGPRTIEVTYSTDNDDEITGLVLSVLYDRVAAARPQRGYREPSLLVATRPLAIELRAESSADASAKGRGLTHEWQSGDAEFDRRVYVNTPTTDGAVLQAVLNADVRGPVLELLAAGFARVLIDEDGRVEARLPRAGFVADASGETALAAFERMLDALPPVTPSGAKHPRRPLGRLTTALGVLGGVGWSLNVGLVVGLTEVTQTVLGRTLSSPAIGAWALVVLVALGCGVGGAAVYSGAVARRARGRSDSVELVAGAQVAAFGAFSVVGFVAAFVAALALANAR